MKILRLALYLLLVVLAGLGGFAVGALTVGGYTSNMLLELVTGETPQEKMTAYLQAIQAQDRAAALAAWKLPDPAAQSYAALSQRRDQVTGELLARQITGFTIFDTEWWSTCCEPGVTPLARNAGGARTPVQVIDTQGNSWHYTLDVFVDGPYWGAALGNPYRRWLLRDVATRDEKPIYWQRVYSGEIHEP